MGHCFDKAAAQTWTPHQSRGIPAKFQDSTETTLLLSPGKSELERKNVQN
jgi:hypothetical protein